MTTAISPSSNPLKSVEDRLAVLEADVARLKLQLDDASTVDPDWLAKLTGSMKDVPEFADVIRYGREFRESHPYIDEDPDAW